MNYLHVTVTAWQRGKWRHRRYWIEFPFYVHLKPLLLSVQRGGKCYVVFSGCLAHGDLETWRSNEGVLLQGMKLICLRYHGNSRVKLQAKLSFPLLLLPGLITRVGLTWVFCSHLHPCQENSTKSLLVYLHSLNSTHSFTSSLFTNWVQTAEKGPRTGIRKAVQIHLIYPAVPAL